MTSLCEVYCRVELSDAQRVLTVRRPPAFFELCRSTGVFVREADDLKIAQRFIAGARSGQKSPTRGTDDRKQNSPPFQPSADAGWVLCKTLCKNRISNPPK